MTEVWRDIEGYTGFYSVSNEGLVQSIARVVPHKRYGEQRIKERTLKPAVHSDGYRMVVLCKGSKQRSCRISQLVAAAFHPDTYFEGAHACHNNGDPSDDRAVNLRWDTHSGNMGDRGKHGTLARGERNGKAKLNASDVQEIRRHLAQGGMTYSEIAEPFEVTGDAIRAIRSGKSWSHLPNPWRAA